MSKEDGIKKTILHNNDNKYTKEDFAIALKRNIKKLNEIKKLEYDWNGNKAEPFSKDHVNYVEQIIRRLYFQPDIFPAADGGIQLECEVDKRYLEIEIFEDKTVEIFEVDNLGNEKINGYRTMSIDSIIRIINDWFPKDMIENNDLLNFFDLNDIYICNSSGHGWFYDGDGIYIVKKTEMINYYKNWDYRLYLVEQEEDNE